MAEKATLSKQLTGAVQQYQVANTDNLVLKSNVEALRIKVNLILKPVRFWETAGGF